MQITINIHSIFGYDLICSIRVYDIVAYSMINILCSTNTACWNACLFCLTELEGDHVDYVEQEIGAKGIPTLL